MQFIEVSQRKTGYIHEDNGNGGQQRPPKQSWHRTLGGAIKALHLNKYYGNVYEIIGDDKTVKVQGVA